MTGGTVVVLGETGRNFAAGMSGGLAYVYDMDGLFAKRCNMAQVELGPVLAANEQHIKDDKSTWHNVVPNGERQPDELILKSLIERHARYTGSERAKAILENWSTERKKFVKVFPVEYRRALAQMHAASQTAAQVTA